MEIQWREHITSDPKIMFGKPVIKNTRIPVDLILEKLAAGETQTQLLSAYTSISAEDISACLQFASEAVKSEIIQKIA